MVSSSHEVVASDPETGSSEFNTEDPVHYGLSDEEEEQEEEEEPKQEEMQAKPSYVRLQHEYTLYKISMEALADKAIPIMEVDTLEHLNWMLEGSVEEAEAKAADNLIQSQDLVLLKVENDKLEKELKAIQAELNLFKQEKYRLENRNDKLCKDLGKLQVGSETQNAEISKAAHVHRRNLQAEVMRKTIHNLEHDNERLQRMNKIRLRYEREAGMSRNEAERAEILAKPDDFEYTANASENDSGELLEYKSESDA
ncbi:hypothetical protein ABW21_db0206876 [Orbilia brochopaga]|nr:hypothetical protein ABW21_db0206876 [Drechslerella brochopaga]